MNLLDEPMPLKKIIDLHPTKIIPELYANRKVVTMYMRRRHVSG